MRNRKVLLSAVLVFLLAVGIGVRQWAATFRAHPDSRPSLAAADILRGWTLFLNNCAVCHAASNLHGVPFPQVTDPKMRALADREIFSVATFGKGLMRGYRERFSDRERWEIVAYIRALQQSHESALPIDAAIAEEAKILQREQ